MEKSECAPYSTYTNVLIIAICLAVLLPVVSFGVDYFTVKFPRDITGIRYDYPVRLTGDDGVYEAKVDATGHLLMTGTVATTTEVYDTFETQVVLLASNVASTITPSMPAATQRGFVVGNQGAGSITYNINAAATATSFLLAPTAIVSLSPAKVTTLSARGYGAVATVEVQFFGKL